MNQYLELKQKQRARLDAFPIVFAFNMDQFKQAMETLGLTVNDTDKVVKVSGGGFLRKTDVEAFKKLLSDVAAEHAKAIADDVDGTGFVFEMFDYELSNHEYGYTHDDEDTLRALGLTSEEIEANPVLLAALNKAKAKNS